MKLNTLLVILCGCDGGSRPNAVERDTRPAFVLDASKPFIIEFGRGSGRSGLDSVKVGATGLVELCRISGGANFETTSLHLSGGDVMRLVTLVNSQQITTMGRTYSDPGVADGTQWVLWIQQSPSEKSIYFNNSFPKQITAFASGLDAILQTAGLSTASWRHVPKQTGLDQQAALWARIQPAK